MMKDDSELEFIQNKKLLLTDARNVHACRKYLGAEYAFCMFLAYKSTTTRSTKRACKI